MAWKTGCILYGCDITTAGAMPDKTTVEALTGVVSETLLILGTYSGINYQDDILVYLDDSTMSAKKIHKVFQLKLKPKAFPANATTMESFYLENILNKSYHWFYFDDFPLRPNDPATSLPIANTKVFAISILPSDNAPDTNAIKSIIINCRARYG